MRDKLYLRGNPVTRLPAAYDLPCNGRIIPEFSMRTLVVLIALALAACDAPPSTLADIIRKAEKAGTRAELERAPGKPDRLTRIGPAETWTYKATDGEISFLVVGDSVQR